jgi:hypothetical protein
MAAAGVDETGHDRLVQNPRMLTILSRLAQ